MNNQYSNKQHNFSMCPFFCCKINWGAGVGENQFRDADQKMIRPTGISYHVRIRAFGSAYFLPKISPYFGLDGWQTAPLLEGQFMYKIILYYPQLNL